MVINMATARLRTVSDLQTFVRSFDASDSIQWADDRERYLHIERCLNRMGYRDLRKGHRCVVLDYLRLTSGYSRAQLNRLVKQWSTSSELGIGQRIRKRYCAPTQPFCRKYLDADIELLAQMDTTTNPAPGRSSICAHRVAHLLKRAFETYGQSQYQRISAISSSHIYNLRRSKAYLSQRTHHDKTRAGTGVNHIGLRQAPQDLGCAGHLRIDTVHQGDLDGRKGIYTLNIVDTATQWQVLGCVGALTHEHVVPAIEAMLRQIPFEIRGLHSDNGSEFINYMLSNMLKHKAITQTKSRPRRSTDNALIEGKNASVVRQHMGHSHIATTHAQAVQDFYSTDLTPHLNLHRPCMFATEAIDARGKCKRTYKACDVATPLERLELLVRSGKATLKAGRSLERLQSLALARTDLQAYQDLNEAKKRLFAKIARSTVDVQQQGPPAQMRMAA